VDKYIHTSVLHEMHNLLILSCTARQGRLECAQWADLGTSRDLASVNSLEAQRHNM